MIGYWYIVLHQNPKNNIVTFFHSVHCDNDYDLNDPETLCCSVSDDSSERFDHFGILNCNLFEFNCLTF